MKKILAMVLAVAMVLGGIYWVDMAGDEVKAATEANSDMLNVKVQVATDDSNVIRFVTSVDSLDYSNVGFEVTPEGGVTKTYTTTRVFERIASSEENVEYTFSPKVVDTSSEYFVTAKLRAEADVDYTVKAFATQKNGEKIYGATRCVGVKDGKSTTTLNLTYEATTAPEVGSTINVTYGKDNQATTAEVLAVDGKNVSVRVTVNPTTLPSATKFTFGSTGSAIYRNLYTKYTGEGTQDTTWYDVYLAADSKETEFTIATNADLYGFMNMMVNQTLFKNQTIYLVSDIAANDNVSDAVVEAWAGGTEAPYKWTSSGTDSTATQFSGTFDGQMHTISGVYMKQNKQRAGFFGCTAKESTVKNFYLTDSYFKSDFTTNVQHLGSVAGECWGTLENVYSDAIVVGSHNRVGGIVGVLNTVTAAEALGMQAKVNNCWFDGEVRMTTDNGRYFGGIVGYVMQKEVQITDCLFTGKLTYTYKSGGVHAGGILGGNNNKPLVHIEDVVSAGEILGEYWICTGTIYGYRTSTSTKFEVVNGYGVKESLVIPEGTEACTSGQLNGGGASGSTGTGPGTALSEANLQGINAYKNTLLDFENTWVARTGKVPALKVFEEKYTAEEVITDFGTIAQDGWYDANNNCYGIHTAAGLRGFSDISQTQQFSGKTIYLSKDIDLNPGWVAPKDSTTQVTGAQTFTPIGRKNPDGTGNGFRGTFDGRNHEIRGLYCNTSKETKLNQCALFAEIDTNAVVKNFAVTNSYIYGASNWNGGIVGICYVGTIQNVYCDATIVAASAAVQTGGIVGRCEGTVTGCWFNGNIYSLKSDAGDLRLAGIVGCTYSGVKNAAPERTLTVTDCLYTGTITYRIAADNMTANSGVGGILGKDAMRNISVTMTNCVSAGTIDCNVLKGTGAVMGQILSTGYNNVESTLAMTNCYGAKDCVPGRTDREIIQSVPSAIADNVTQTDCATLLKSELQGSAIYNNANIKLDYTKWIARSNASPIPTVFVDWIVPASETVAKPAE